MTAFSRLAGALALLITLVPHIAQAQTTGNQDTLRPRWSLQGGPALNMHTADFRALPGVPNCCPQFESGSGLGPTLGASYEFPMGDALLVSIGARYSDNSAALETDEPVAVVAGGEVRTGAFRHTIDATFASVGVEPALVLRAAPGLFVRAGLHAGAVLSPAYAQKEQIVEPAASGTFLDANGADSGLRTRNENSGALPDAASMLVQGVVGLEYELPLNASRTLLVAPGVHYALGFTDLVNGSTWKPNALRFTLALKYQPVPSKPVLRDTIHRRDTTVVATARGTEPGVRLDAQTASTERVEDGASIVEHTTVVERYTRSVPKTSTLTASVTAVGVENGREESAAVLRIEEFLQTNTHPLLGYVFFAERSSEIPERYARMTSTAADAFQPQSLFGEDAMGIAHNVLNIVGYNLRKHPAAELTITGCNAGAGAEKGDRALSRARAEAVRRYLAEVWGIAPERLPIVDRELPAVASNTRTQDGAEENRRVEITSTVPEVTDVFVVYDTTRNANPPTLRFKPVVTAAEPIASWKVTVRQRGEVLKEYSGNGAPPRTLNWDVEAKQRAVPRFSEPVEIELEAATTDGERTSATTTLATDVVTVQRKQAANVRDYRIERYNLVLFDVGKSTITGAHQRTADLIRSRLKPGSIVTVEGFTDRTGDGDANRRLALARAQSTAAALGRTDATVAGVGEDRLLYDNDLPEGRFYCRTVRITVKTPVR